MIGVFTPLGTLMELRRRLWPVALLFGAFWLLASGCYQWRAAPSASEALARPERPQSVRVFTRSGRAMQVFQPRLEGDTLRGMLQASLVNNDSGPVAIALGDITRVDVREPDAAATVAVGVGVTALVVLGLAAAMASADPPQPAPSQGLGLGSCPLVYSWDGLAWRLDSGTFSGAVARGLARTDVDNLTYAVAERGVLRLRLANAMDETDFVDAVSVTAVDHPAGLSVLPDAQGNLHTVAALTEPLTVTDDAGRDQRARVRASDGWSWESALVARDSADPRALRDGLELAFARPAGGHAHLVFEAVNTSWAGALMHRFVETHGRATQAWYDSLAAIPLYGALTRQRLEEEASLVISLWDGRRWVPQGSVWSIGQESPKRLAQELDLTMVPGETVRVRIESAPSLWAVDFAALDVSPDVPVIRTELAVVTATDSLGADRRSTLVAADGDVLRLETGGQLDVTLATPPARPGLTRSYMLRSTGWYELRTRTRHEPDVALLQRVALERGAIARLSIGMMNEALAPLARGATPPAAPR